MKEEFIFTIRHVIERGARLYGKKTALALAGSDPADAISFSSVLQQANAFASHLISQGIGTSDKVALLGDSQPNWPIAYFGIISVGAVAVPLLPDFSKKEIHTILAHSGAKVLVVSSKLANKSVQFITDQDHAVYRLDDLFFVPKKVCQTFVETEAFGSLPGVDTMKTKVNLEKISQSTPQENDLASIIYTSGTTGASKGVMLSHKNITSNAYACRKQFVSLRPGDIMLSILPLSHSYEFTIGLILPMIQGCEVHYLGKAPAASILLPLLKKVRPHVMLSVPLLIEKIYKSSVLPKISSNKKIARLYLKPFMRKFINRTIGRKLKQTFGGRLKFFGVGGAALDPNVEQFLKEARFPYAIGYGLTETAPLLAGAGPKQTKVGTTGYVLNNVELRIVSSEQNGDVGEIQARGPNIMQGYYLNEDLTNEVFTDDRWFKTGDLGSISKGRLSIRGRLKTMILGPGGENIYPELIEMLINNHQYVEESLVVENGGGLAAMIKLNLEAMAENLMTTVGDVKDDAVKYLAKIREEVNRDLGIFSRISSVHLQDEPFERTPTLKIKRYLYNLKEKLIHPNSHKDSDSTLPQN
ncbi:MAG: AMP-binding protein [Sphaerochaetaceae bacterium]|jgi:long-chain acyl-CoA synthetase|nr:AMP-binding protein [Sphaerochaetaceae bacterium]MDD4260211.1 AMP-binding protein [Sphaerochaetaceae bacterium]MDD4841474.1 AMP-binding protein [Sphaerochaetaceae bacterium]